MKIHITRLDDDYHMEAVNNNGNSLQMDGAPGVGGHNLGMRRVQLLLSAVGGFSAINVIPYKK